MATILQYINVSKEHGTQLKYVTCKIYFSEKT